MQTPTLTIAALAWLSAWASRRWACARHLWLVLLASGLLASAALAQQPVPALTARAMDSTATLSAEQLRALEAKLSEFEQRRGTQIVVLMLPTTQPEDIAAYANRVADSWKIGRKEVGDGLLLIVAKQDRQVRIEVARALEGAVPDLAARRVIDQAITPMFKQGNFYGGLNAGLDQLFAYVTGENLPTPGATPSGNAGFEWMDLAVFLFIAVPVVGSVARGILGNKWGALATGGVAGVIAMLVTSSLLVAAIAALLGLLFTLISRAAGQSGGRRGGGGSHWGGGSGGFGGGSGGGGGFSSGGGGSFGGGGASGGW